MAKLAKKTCPNDYRKSLLGILL